jgi:hypothetical protein
MTLTKIAGVVLAVLLVTTGMAAALPGNAPADSQTGQADDKDDDAAEAAPDERADDAANESTDDQADDTATDRGPAIAATVTDADSGAADEARGANVSAQGPPVDLPARVPDFVSDVHQQIRDYKVGDVTGDLGAMISDLTPGGPANGNESQQETPNRSPQGVGSA